MQSSLIIFPCSPSPTAHQFSREQKPWLVWGRGTVIDSACIISGHSKWAEQVHCDLGDWTVEYGTSKLREGIGNFWPWKQDRCQGHRRSLGNPEVYLPVSLHTVQLLFLVSAWFTDQGPFRADWLRHKQGMSEEVQRRPVHLGAGVWRRQGAELTLSAEV